MNRSHRLKIENWISTNTITVELLLICLAKLNPIIKSYAYKVKIDANVSKTYGSNSCYSYGNGENISKKEFYTNIRKPMMDVLLRDYHLTFDEILARVNEIPDIKIPTMKICQQVQGIINGGNYILE